MVSSTARCYKVDRRGLLIPEDARLCASAAEIRHSVFPAARPLAALERGACVAANKKYRYILHVAGCIAYNFKCLSAWLFPLG